MNNKGFDGVRRGTNMSHKTLCKAFFCEIRAIFLGAGTVGRSQFLGACAYVFGTLYQKVGAFLFGHIPKGAYFPVFILDWLSGIAYWCEVKAEKTDEEARC